MGYLHFIDKNNLGLSDNYTKNTTNNKAFSPFEEYVSW